MTAAAMVPPILALLMLALPLSIAATNIALTLLALVLLVFQSQFDWSRMKHPLVYALGAYCAASLLCALAGNDATNSFRAVLKDFHKLWVVSLLLLTLEGAPVGGWASLGGGFAAACAVGLGQVAVHLGAEGPWARPRGYVHAVTYGEQLALGLLGGICLLRFCPPGKARRLIACFLALCGATLILNQTRAAFLSAALGFALLALLDRKLRRYLFWVAPAVILVAGLWEAMPTGGRSMREFFHDSQAPEAGARPSAHLVRYALWKTAIRMFEDHPMTGVGPGNYGASFGKYFQGTLPEQVSGSAHNLYLHQLAERGILGALALGVLLFVLVRGAWRRAERHPSAWTLWAFSASIAFLLMNLTEVAFQNEQVTTLLLFIWAAAEAESRTRGAAAAA